MKDFGVGHVLTSMEARARRTERMWWKWNERGLKVLFM